MNLEGWRTGGAMDPKACCCLAAYALSDNGGSAIIRRLYHETCTPVMIYVVNVLMCL